jgi:RimJ/RimL family protein N-acetyltransferase
MKKSANITLSPISKSDIEFLYELLNERNSKSNISHKKIPTFNQHTKFIISKPYSKWYIIYYNDKKAGSIYLSKNNEIGIFLSKKFQGKNIGNFALNELMKQNPRKRFLANVNPKNKKSILFFKNNDFKLIQYTFEKIK